MPSITDFRTKILALLDDPNQVKYTSNQVDQALREALSKYDQFLPVEKTYIMNGTGEQRITLPADFTALRIVHVELLKAKPTSKDAISFSAYKVDEQWMIETNDRVVSVTESIVIQHSARNYIDGLDSAAGTSVALEDTDALALGAAGFAAVTRSHSRVEAINLAPDVSRQLQALGQKYLDEFYRHFTSASKGFVTANWKLDTAKDY